MQECSRCKINPKSEKHAWCKPCQAAYYQDRRKDVWWVKAQAEKTAEWWAKQKKLGKDREWHRKFNLRRHGNDAAEWYEQKFKEQHGRCAICGAKARPVRKGGIPRLCADHDHKTRKLRALLCVKCNFAISRLEEIPNWHRKALKYLDAHRGSV